MGPTHLDAKPSRRDRLAYHGARAAAEILSRLPARTAARIARVLGAGVYLVQGRHLERIARHHEILFGAPIAGRELRRFARAFYEHLALLVVEIVRMRCLDAANVNRIVNLSELEALRPLLAEGRGILATSGHAGNWEYSGHVASLAGFPVHAIARPLANPLLDGLFQRLRESGGQKVFAKWNVLWSLKKLLDRGAVVGINADQDTTVNQVFVPFGTRMAATSATIGQLSRATGAPVAVVTVNRQPGDIRYRFHVWTVIRREKTADAEADARTVMAEVNEALVRAIRTYPEQWLWTHRRWKTRPPGETSP
ncbi:MAG: lysophospholipid acyltransferase family protein [Planctomycetes bacterium]|nr:lysophospholipid acyltransferase family protein [Planctomycetota bacterium]